jgi:hypothetical protein
VKSLPEKQAGVGLARKIVMDEAVRRFRKSGNPQGIIIGFDADSICRENFLSVVWREFQHHHLNGASVFFEHPVEGMEDPRLYEGIINYELHLRYYIMAQKYAGFPYAFQTIGSSMAVRCDVYEKQGGMNRKKAGEDFYFLHKIIPLGGYKEINDTAVIPSPRISERVPFGTGRAILDWMNKEQKTFLTYNPAIFESLKTFLNRIPYLFEEKESEPDPSLKNLPEEIKIFLEKEKIKVKLEEFRNQSACLSSFTDRLFRWFNGLKLLQYVHFAQKNYYTGVPLPEAIRWLAEKYPIHLSEPDNRKQLLFDIRDFNRKNPYHYQKTGPVSDEIE